MSSLNALPTLATPEVPLDSCVSSYEMLNGSVATIVHWKCNRDGDALRAERQHSTYVLSVVASGACCVHDAGWQTTLDPVNALLHRPGSTYRTTHPYGFIDSGWNIAYDKLTGDEVLERAGVSEKSWDRPALTVTTRPAHLALRQIVAIQRHHAGIERGLTRTGGTGIGTTGNYRSRFTQRANVAPRDNAGGAQQNCGTRARLSQRTLLHTSQPERRRKGKQDHRQVHLCRLFKESVGVPLRVYLHRLRLSSAIEAITLHGTSLAHAALQSGFCSQAHMTSVCTRVFGSPPGALRESRTTGELARRSTQ